MKKLYIIKNSIMIFSGIFLIMSISLMAKNNSIGFLLSPIACIMLFIVNRNRFKKIEYENPRVDCIVKIISIVTFSYIIIMSIYILFIK